ncbi:MAG: hypothetical protein HRU11_12035 [Parvularculaceae bacterium]|nr:hypothetical protein [Parvularculaceae bacterium]
MPVVTTAAYMTFLGGPGEEGPAVYLTERWDDIVTVWLTESIGFAIGIIAALGLAALPGSERASWNAIALGSLGGLLSTAIGIGAFKGFGTNGEEFLVLWRAVVELSFFFFFFGKAATAFGVFGLGVELVRRAGALGKVLGVVAVLAGLVGGVLNIVAMGSGLSLVMQAGFAGVVATAVGAVAALVLTRVVSAREEASA